MWVLCRHEEINQDNSNALLVISSKIAKLEPDSIIHNANYSNLLLLQKHRINSLETKCSKLHSSFITSCGYSLRSFQRPWYLKLESSSHCRGNRALAALGRNPRTFTLHGPRVDALPLLFGSSTHSLLGNLPARAIGRSDLARSRDPRCCPWESKPRNPDGQKSTSGYLHSHREP
jgi:hypothetical protein